MNERYKIIQESGCRNALEYNKKAKEKLNPIFIAIEEIGTFNVRNRDDKEFYDLIFEKFPEIAPKSFGGYRRMKASNSDNYKKLLLKAEELLGYNFYDKQ